MNGIAATDAPPRFCSIDGMALLTKRHLHSNGFDPFTGIERPKREYVALECPTKGHDVWVLVNDKWVEP